MKQPLLKKIGITALAIGLCLCVHGQKPEEHAPTTYTDSLGNFYIQVDLPLYFYVSTSPDDPKQRLNRSDIKENKPVYMDGPGKHHIRHADNINHRAEVFEIYADGKAPETTSSFTDAPVYSGKDMMYYGKGLNIRLNVRDDMSGVKGLYQSFDGASFTPYQPQSVTKEGIFNYQYYAVDNVGNVEKPKQKTFTVDLSPPVTYHNIEGIAQNSIISTSSLIYLTPSDSLSGVYRTFYRFDDGSEKVYTPGSMIPFLHLSDGEHTLYYYSEDRVQNKESVRSVTFFFDKTAPIMSADVLGDRFIVEDKVYFSGRTKLKLTAVDNKSGIKEIKYSIDDKPFTEYDDPFYLPSKSGKHTIRYYAVDQMGNSNADEYHHNTGIVYVDLTGPKLSYTVTGPNFVKGDIRYIGPTSKITLKGTDSESGVQYLSYNLNEDNEEIRYGEPFGLTRSGSNTIRYYGYDNVNNRNASEFMLMVDAEGPEIFHTFSVKPVGTDKLDGMTDAEYAGEYPSYVMLYLAATDQMTGNGEITYSIDGGSELPFTSPIGSFQKDRTYTVKVKAKDKLGNVSEKMISFRTTAF